jgi:hypothetical protein
MSDLFKTCLKEPEGDLKVDRCVEFEVMIEEKVCKILVVRWCNDDNSKENYGIKIHKDNPLENNEIEFAVFKQLYLTLLKGLEDVD